MKKIILLFTFLVTTQLIASECNWNSITEKDSKYIYTPECHLKVGELIKEEKKREKQVEELKKSIELKELALDISDQRIMKWRNEAYSQNQALERSYKYSKYNDLLYFGLGIVTTSLAVWGAGQLK